MSDKRFDLNLKRPSTGVAQSRQTSAGVGPLKLKALVQWLTVKFILDPD